MTGCICYCPITGKKVVKTGEFTNIKNVKISRENIGVCQKNIKKCSGICSACSILMR